MISGYVTSSEQFFSYIQDENLLLGTDCIGTYKLSYMYYCTIPLRAWRPLVLSKSAYLNTLKSKFTTHFNALFNALFLRIIFFNFKIICGYPIWSNQMEIMGKNLFSKSYKKQFYLDIYLRYTLRLNWFLGENMFLWCLYPITSWIFYLLIARPFYC